MATRNLFIDDNYRFGHIVAMGSLGIDSLRVVQFNLENLFVYIDHLGNQDLTQLTEAQWQKMSISLHPNKSLKKLWAIAEIIRELDPDILLVNEVGGPESLDNFNRHFLHKAFHVHIMEGNSDRGIDVGYLTKATLPLEFELRTHRQRPIDFIYPFEKLLDNKPPSHFFSRDVAELLVRTPNECDPKLALLLIHLKSKLDSDGIDPGGTLRRGAEAKTLAKIYNEQRQQLNGIPFIVAGDFNGNASPENTDPEFLDIYHGTDLVEVWSLIGLRNSARQSMVLLEAEAKSRPMQLDYFFVSPELKDKVNKSSSKVYRFKDMWGKELSAPRSMAEKYSLPSDHFPIILELNDL